MTMKLIPEPALTQHLAVVGKTGGGKTITAKLIVEQVVADRARVCVLDPLKSDWWGLTSSADGKRPGLPFTVLGGPRGHVPLHADAGKAIAELVANGSLPLSIIDMADFAPGGQLRFFKEFAPALLRKMRGVLYLVLEEAHLFAPKERGGMGDENMALHWAKVMATAGRSKGVRLIVLTQRTQALHNAILGSCDTLVAHRLTAPADQKPIIDWLKSNAAPEVMKEVAGSLANLKRGEAWLCSGEAQVFERRQFPMIRTFDNSATPTGDGTEHQVKTATVDQEKLRSLIGTAVAEAEANDPKKLKARIADLERQVKAIPQKPAAERLVTKEVKVEVPVLKEGQLARVEKLLERVEETRDRMAEEAAKLREVLGPVFARPANATHGIVHKTGPERIRTPSQTNKTSPPVLKPAQTGITQPSNGHLPKGERAILSALIQYPNGLRREQLTVLTGYKRSSRDAYLQRLREPGYVEAVGDKVMATEAGRAALPDAEPLPTGPDLQAFWLQRLPLGERAILEVLIERYPEPVDREVLTEATSYKRSSRDAYLQRLAAKELVTGDRGSVRASETLFG